MKKNLIYDKIEKARKSRFITNCYSLNVADKCQDLWAEGDEFLFSYSDHGINRLIFFVRDWDSIDRLMYRTGTGSYYLEFMSRDPEEYVPAGAALEASMMRLANSDCRTAFESNSAVLKFKDTALAEMAQVSDVVEINEILWGTFKTEISHLLTDEELTEKIKEKQISIHRDREGKIDALLQAEVMPKKFYINQVVNRAEKNVIHAILLDRLGEYVKSGGKYLYAWVDSKNIASLKFHHKYGMKHDGMWSMIYYLEK